MPMYVDTDKYCPSRREVLLIRTNGILTDYMDMLPAAAILLRPQVVCRYTWLLVFVLFSRKVSLVFFVEILTIFKINISDI